MVTTELGHRRWLQVEERPPLLLVPIGSMEQHGPHLPLSTDTMIATAVSRTAAAQLTATGVAVLVAPAISYGASGEHESFPGTVSIGQEALHTVLVEYGRSACRWASELVFVNGHGGNVATLIKAVELLRYEQRPVAWTACDLPGADAHAGATETSLLLYLAPETVRTDLAEPGANEPLAQLLPMLRSAGVRAVSANGVLGDPTNSSAEHGHELFSLLVSKLLSELSPLNVGRGGRLSTAVDPQGAG